MQVATWKSTQGATWRIRRMMNEGFQAEVIRNQTEGANATISMSVSTTRAEVWSWIDDRFKRNSDKYQDMILDVVEETLLDGLTMAATDLPDCNVENNFYRLQHSIMSNIFDEAGVRDALFQMATNILCSNKNIGGIATVMKVKFFQSDEVMDIMVNRMQIQADSVVSQAIWNA